MSMRTWRRAFWISGMIIMFLVLVNMRVTYYLRLPYTTETVIGLLESIYLTYYQVMSAVGIVVSWFVMLISLWRGYE